MPSRLTSKLLLGVLLCCASAAVIAADAAREVSNAASRRFGLLIGERFSQQVTVAVPMSHRLERGSLPKTGRANRWFELQDLDVGERIEAGERIYALTLHYQLMTSDEAVGLAALPRPALRFTTAPDTPNSGDGAVSSPSAALQNALSLRLAAQQVSVSPISEVEAWDHEGLQALRPEHGTPLLDTTATKQRIAAYAGALSLLALYWLYRIFGVPFWARSRGPFARAWRTLRRQHAADSVAIRNAMRDLHHAFDRTFGKTVFHDQVDEFLARHPRFAPQRDAIKRFYELSRHTFYAESSGGDVTLAELRSLARRLSFLERGLT